MNRSELTPDTTYRLRLSRPLAESEVRTVTRLYLPVIHQEAYSLYLFFYHSIPAEYGVSEFCTHRTLMQMLGTDLMRFINARRRLEGVGLLSSYRWDGGLYYEYLLHPPLTPAEFFQSDVLTLSLFNHLGKEGYRALREKYLSPVRSAAGPGENREEVTASFTEVSRELLLLSSPPSSTSESVRFIRQMEAGGALPPFPSTAHQKEIPSYIDFDYLAGFYPAEERKALFSEENKAFFLRKAIDLGLDSVQLGMILRDSYLGGGRGWDYRRFEDLLKRLKRGGEPEEKRETARAEYVAPRTVEEHLRTLKSITPIQLLRNYQDGGEIAQPDLKLIDYLLNELGLPQEVVNVLIDFILLTNDNKLPRAYTEKIAGSWKRKGFKTAEEAFAFARQEYWRSMEKQSGNRAESQKKESGNIKSEKGNRKREVPRYIWLQAEEDAKREKEREERERNSSVNLEEIKKLIEELGEKG